MLQEFEARNNIDAAGHPSGGSADRIGIAIDWQNGPLGRGENRQEPNGAFVETVIAIAKQRLQFYNDNGFECEENTRAIEHLASALDWLNLRTERREAQQVEGTHAGS